MPQARITINGVVGSNDDLPINTPVLLSNDDVGGELTYAWVITDQPPGAPLETLSNPAIKNPTLTVKHEGTFRLQLTVNALLPSAVVDVQIAGVRQIKSRQRQPAAAETVEDSATKGWSPTANAFLAWLEARAADPGLYVGVAGEAAMTRGAVCYVSGQSTLKSGLPGEEYVPTLKRSHATVAASLVGVLFVLEGGVDGSAAPALGVPILARRAGQFVSFAGAGATGDAVFVSDAGTLSTVAGTISRRIGYIEAVIAGAVTTMVDGAGAAGVGDATPATIDVGDATIVGVSPLASRQDHQHRLLAPAAPADVTKAAADAGAAVTVARADHKHDISTAAAGSITIDDVGAEGSATTLARSDHLHTVTAPSAPAAVTKAAADAGTSKHFCRDDHKHDVSTAAPSSIGTSNTEGAATSLARSNHIHDHGAQSTGTHHAAATESVAGFLSSADKTKLDDLWNVVGTDKVTTTDATQTTCQTIPCPISRTFHLTVDVAAHRSTGASGAGYTICATYRTDGSSVPTLVGSVTALVTHEDVANWDATLDINANTIRVRVTGEGGSSIDWTSISRYHVAPT